MLLEIFKARKFGMGFFGGVKFWSWDFFGVLLKALGIYLGFDFCPHSIIPITSPEYPSWDCKMYWLVKEC